jgi:hypothetical protein
MAATVIDSLVVELGLDPKKLTQGQREAIDSFKKFGEDAERGGRNVEDSSKRATDALSGIRTQALSLFAVFSGGKGLVDFGVNVTRINAGVGRLERNIGQSASTITAWQGAARIFGGDAQSMAASFTSLSDAFAGWKIGIVSPVVADLRAISSAGGKTIDMNKGVEQSFLDLADNLKAIHDRDPAQAGLLGRKIGLDPALFDLLIKGSAGAKEVLDYVRKIGVATKEDTDAFGELEKRMNQMGVKAESLGRKLLGGENGGASKIIAVADWLNLSPSDAWKALKDQVKREAAIWRGEKVDDAKPAPLFTPTPGGSGVIGTAAEKEAFIRSEAAKRGIDPTVAMAVAKSEGFSSYVGDRGSSFGAFQLHYGGVASGGMAVGGLGDEFTKKTGLDARNPATEREQIQFALDQAKQGGWGPWHGWKGAQFAGIGQGGGSQGSTTEINIEKVEINAGPNADGTKMGQDFKTEVQRRQSAAAQSNNGQN